MSDLLKINVNDHTEKKNGLTYLSWAWAWAEVLKVDPNAEWEAVEYSQPDGTSAPCMYVGGGTALVKTRVTIKGKTRTCVLPVMDHRNKAIKDPDALTKAISMHGLGLYIYAGEDLPEGDAPPEGDKKPQNVIPASFRSSPTMDENGKKAIELLEPGVQEYLRDLAAEIEELVKEKKAFTAVQRIEGENLDNEQKLGLWSVLGSKARSAIKDTQKAIREGGSWETPATAVA
jgi:hypothetical protein